MDKVVDDYLHSSHASVVPWDWVFGWLQTHNGKWQLLGGSRRALADQKIWYKHKKPNSDSFSKS